MSSNKKFNRKRAVENVTRVFVDPVILFTGSGMDEVPGSLRKRIIPSRLKALTQAYVNGVESYSQATDDEALAYLMTASLRTPFDGDYAEIFLWLSKNYCEGLGMDVPEFLDVDLSDHQRDLLEKLKEWIREQQNKSWKKMRRAEKEERINELTEKQREFIERMADFLENLWPERV